MAIVCCVGVVEYIATLGLMLSNMFHTIDSSLMLIHDTCYEFLRWLLLTAFKNDKVCWCISIAVSRGFRSPVIPVARASQVGVSIQVSENSLWCAPGMTRTLLAPTLLPPARGPSAAPA